MPKIKFVVIPSIAAMDFFKTLIEKCGTHKTYIERKISKWKVIWSSGRQ